MRKIGEAIRSAWHHFDAIVCIMGCGIVVRTIAPLIKNKMVDPAVVVMDEDGKFAISLISGHLGGANELAREVAAITGGQAVITTASDLQGKLAVDLVAQKAGLHIENSRMLSRVAAAVLDGEPLWIFDPEGLFVKHLPPGHSFQVIAPPVERGDVADIKALIADTLPRLRAGLGIWVSEMIEPSRVKCLKLRPPSLVVGIGCNRGTQAEEIIGLVERVFRESGLSTLSIGKFASVDLKSNEPGLLEAAGHFNKPIEFYARQTIQGIAVPNPSSTVARHIGVKSVCEASAIWSTGTGRLLVPKRKSINCTMAIARASCS
ncbi:MAG: cobalamin biosynthesis protein [Syntrophobacter sp.]